MLVKRSLSAFLSLALASESGWRHLRLSSPLMIRDACIQHPCVVCECRVTPSLPRGSRQCKKLAKGSLILIMNTARWDLRDHPWVTGVKAPRQAGIQLALCSHQTEQRCISSAVGLLGVHTRQNSSALSVILNMRNHQWVNGVNAPSQPSS